MDDLKKAPKMQPQTNTYIIDRVGWLFGLSTLVGLLSISSYLLVM
jgi:hypothetical protein